MVSTPGPKELGIAATRVASGFILELTIIPNHRELKIGTPAGALRQAGVSVEEFISAL